MFCFELLLVLFDRIVLARYIREAVLLLVETLLSGLKPLPWSSLLLLQITRVGRLLKLVILLAM